MREEKTYIRIINAAVFILLEIAAIGMLRHSNSLQNVWISRISHNVMRVLWSRNENLKYYFSLREVNDKLAEENNKLREKIHYYEEITDISDQINTFDGFSTEKDFSYIPASIMKISRNKQHNYFIINKGYEDGVNAQSGIISASGAIGIVDAVEKHYSYCISFMNSSSSISARLGNKGAAGPLIWDGIRSDGAILKEIPLQAKFEPGDTVWTSGYSSLFPSNIPLGIAGDSRVVNGAVREIRVNLFQDLSSIRYVSVVINNGRDEIINLEQLEQNLTDED